MQINLTPEMEALLARKIDSGDYASADLVIDKALRLFQEQEEKDAGTERVAFERELTARLDSLDRGQCVTSEAAKARVSRAIAEAARQSA